jgi:regulator of cell morphogenesis and NO signaling
VLGLQLAEIQHSFSAARVLHAVGPDGVNYSMINAQATVAHVVLDHSECASIFQRHRIDFCCRGELSVDAACRERGLDASALLAELDRAVAARKGDVGVDPRSLPTAALIAHIVSKHHDHLRQSMPFVVGLATKVARVHGDHNAKLLELRDVVVKLVETLEPHLDIEEKALFPSLVVEAPNRAQLAGEFASMHDDHLAVGALLEQMRGAADDYALPDWACNSYRTLFSELEQLEGDVLRHVHLENQVLMPRFAAE